MGVRLCLLFAAAAFAAAQSAQDRLLSPTASYQESVNGSAIFVLAPRVALAPSTGEVVRDFTADGVEECALTCFEDPECFFFEQCEAEDGCQHVQPHMGADQCRLMAASCNVRLQVQAAGPWVKRIAGFPIYYGMEQVPGYEAQAAQGFDGGNFSCPASLLEGQCAFASLDDAIAACSAMHTCASIVHYRNGTDACSEPVAVLRSLHPSQGTPFVTPTVSTLSKLLSVGDDSSTSLTAAGNTAPSGGSNGNLSVGAIAGISVAGASAAAAALGIAVWLVLRGKHRLRHLQGNGGIEATQDSLEKGAQTSAAGSTKLGQGNEGDAQHSTLNGALPFLNLRRILRRSGDSVSGTAYPHPAAAAMQSPSAVPMPTRVAVTGGHVATSPFSPDAAIPFATGIAPAFPSLSSPCPTSCGPAYSPAVPSVASLKGDLSFSAGSLLHSNKPGSTMTQPEPHSQPLDPHQSTPDPSSQPSLRDQPMLPELRAHVAQQDDRSSKASPDRDPALASYQIVSAHNLPPALRDCLVDIAALQFLRWPNGKLQEIGSGASGHVCKARYMGEVVACKEIDFGGSRAAQEAFIREAARLHQLHHPHVVASYGISLCGDTGTIIMEYCAGRDLHSALGLTVIGTRQRLFGWYARGCRVAYEVSKALNFLHGKGVVHMDLKSHNVLLTGNGTAKLADVGLARLQKGTYLSDVALVGTFAWIAPEVLLGGHQCTSAVDLYSFGILLWEIVTGEEPRRGSLRAPRVPEECPQAVANLMMECVDLEPSRRPSAQQLMQRLGLFCRENDNNS